MKPQELVGVPWSVESVLRAAGLALLHSVWQDALIAVLLAVLLAGGVARARVRYGWCCLALALMACLPLVTVSRLLAGEPPAVEKAPYRDFAPLGPPSEWGPASDTRGDLEALLPILVAVWLLGVMVQSARLVTAWFALRRHCTVSAATIRGPVRACLDRLAARMGVRRPVRLLLAAPGVGPCLVGWLRAAILLPPSALTGLAVWELEALLAHELAHIRRHDYLVNLLQTVIETLFFYHPAVWWVSRKIREEREHCCDDLAIQLLGDRIAYARALMHMEELRTPQTSLAPAAAGGTLSARIRRIVLPSGAAGSLGGWWAGAAGLAVLAAITAAPRMQAAAASTVPPAPVQEATPAIEPAAKHGSPNGSSLAVVIRPKAAPAPRPLPAPRPAPAGRDSTPAPVPAPKPPLAIQAPPTVPASSLPSLPVVSPSRVDVLPAAPKPALPLAPPPPGSLLAAPAATQPADPSGASAEPAQDQVDRERRRALEQVAADKAKALDAAARVLERARASQEAALRALQEIPRAEFQLKSAQGLARSRPQVELRLDREAQRKAAEVRIRALAEELGRSGLPEERKRALVNQIVDAAHHLAAPATPLLNLPPAPPEPAQVREHLQRRLQALRERGAGGSPAAKMIEKRLREGKSTPELQAQRETLRRMPRLSRPTTFGFQRRDGARPDSARSQAESLELQKELEALKQAVEALHRRLQERRDAKPAPDDTEPGKPSDPSQGPAPSPKESDDPLVRLDSIPGLPAAAAREIRAAVREVVRSAPRPSRKPAKPSEPLPDSDR